MAKVGTLDSVQLTSSAASPAAKRTRRSTAAAAVLAADENVSLITRSLGMPTAQLDGKTSADQTADTDDKIVFMSPTSRTKARSQINHADECMDEAKVDGDADEAVLTIGATEGKGHVCKECGVVTKSHEALLKHEDTHIMFDHQCLMCLDVFATAEAKAEHECTAILRGAIQCPRCTQMMHSYLQLSGHTEHVHKVECPVKKMIVSSEEEFQHWRLTVQRDIGFQWRVQNSNKCNTRHFSCNRAGKAGNGSARGRRTGARSGWSKGPIRCGLTCTSFARVKAYPNGRFCVKYCLVHSHPLDPKALRIEPETEDIVVKLIGEGFSLKDIVERVRAGNELPPDMCPSARELIFNEKDVENIALRRRVQAPPRSIKRRRETTATRAATHQRLMALSAAGTNEDGDTSEAQWLEQDIDADAPFYVSAHVLSCLYTRAHMQVSMLSKFSRRCAKVNSDLRGQWTPGTSVYFQAAIENLQQALQYNDQAADLTSTLQMSGSGQLVGDNVIVVNEGVDDDDDDEHVVVDEQQQHVVVATRAHRRDSAVVFEYVPVDVEGESSPDASPVNVTTSSATTASVRAAKSSKTQCAVCGTPHATHEQQEACAAARALVKVNRN